MRQHHNLDPYPLPKEEHPLFVNEPWVIDNSIDQEFVKSNEPEITSDNLRIYVPLDLNKSAIIRRLNEIIRRYGEANEENEMNFLMEVEKLLFQVEIYDQIWYVRHMPETGEHSREGTALVEEFIEHLENIPDGCAEYFPFELIEELKEEYL